MNDKQLKEILNQLHYDEAVCVGGLIGNLKHKLQAEQQANQNKDLKISNQRKEIDNLEKQFIAEQQAHNDLREKLIRIKAISEHHANKDNSMVDNIGVYKYIIEIINDEDSR